MIQQITEEQAGKMASKINYAYFGGYELEVQKHPSQECSSRLMARAGVDLVLPSDLYIILAVYYCGVATTYSIAAILCQMKKQEPEKYILDISVKEEREHRIIEYRLKILTACGIFMVRRVKDKNTTRSLLTYTVSPMAVKFALKMLESPNRIKQDAFNWWPERREFTRQLLVAKFIEKAMESVNIRHFSKSKSYPKPGGGTMEFNYLWLATQKNGVKYSVLVQPFVFTIDPAVQNEKENTIVSENIPFRKLTAFLELSEKEMEKNPDSSTAGLVLIVDKESDFKHLAECAHKWIPERFHSNIMLTSAGLMYSQGNIDTMFVDMDGHFITEDNRLF